MTRTLARKSCEVLTGVDGFQEIDDATPNVVLARFATSLKALKFVRAQKRHTTFQEAKLWAAENRPREARLRGKIASKIKIYLIEVDGHEPKSVLVNYKTFVVSARMAGKVKPLKLATVLANGGAAWEDGENSASSEIQGLITELTEELEI